MKDLVSYQIDINGIKKIVPIENPLGYNIPTYEDEFLIKYFNLTSDSKVLDVGGGSNPFKHANIVTDLYFNEDHHRGGNALTRIPGLEYVECDIKNLPFKDKEFDFVICRHVLEHVDDPLQACNELSRVAKRGFIEVPSRINEYLHGYPNHLWLCDFKEGILYFEAKPFIRNPFRNITRKLHYSDPEFRMSFEYFNRNIFCTQVYWEDKIDVSVIEKKPEFNYFDYSDPYQAAIAHLDYALNYMSFLMPELNEEIKSQLDYAEQLLPENFVIKEVKNLFNNHDKLNEQEYLRLINRMQDQDLLSIVKPQIVPNNKDEEKHIKSLLKVEVNCPYVSIIIRTYNREDLLKRCLKSVEEQYYPNIEVIIVNDGGRDINHLLENRKFKYHYIRHAVNLGKAAALNSGLKMARGKYINILDDDDIIYPEHISILAYSLENSDYRIAYTNSALNIEENIGGQWKTIQKQVQYSQPYDMQLLLQTNYLPILNVMFERELLNECGYANEEFDVLEDWDLWIRFALSNKFFHIKQITAEYFQRINGDNATQNLSGTFGEIREGILERYKQHQITKVNTINIFKPLQNWSKRIASFLYIPDSLENCRQTIKYFIDNFYDSTWVGLYINNNFSNDEITQLSLEFNINDSNLLHLIENTDLENDISSFVYNFDFIIESSSNRIKWLLNESVIPVIPLSDVRKSLMSNPLFGVFYNNDKSLSLVSIIMLTKNQLYYTKLCIESIFRNTRQPFELIIVDNGSDETTIEYLNKLLEEKQNVKVIFNETNLGYAAGNNQGLSLCKGEFVVFINNDVIVTEKWISKMIDAIESNPKYGICGPVSNQVVGIQKVNDLSYKVDSLEVYSMNHGERNKGIYISADRVIGFCMLVKREVIEQIGGFDTNFGIGNFEDDDFCVRARLANYHCIIAKEVFIHHFGSITFKNEIKTKYEDILNENLIKFLKKWDIPISQNGVFTGYNFNQIKKKFDKIEHYSPLVVDNTLSNYLRQAVELFERHEYVNCETVLLQCLKLGYNSEDVWYNLLVIYMQVLDFKSAYKCFEFLDERKPNVGHLKVIWNIFNDKLDDAKRLLSLLLQEYPDDLCLLDDLKYINDLKL